MRGLVATGVSNDRDTASAGGARIHHARPARRGTGCFADLVAEASPACAGSPATPSDLVEASQPAPGAAWQRCHTLRRRSHVTPKRYGLISNAALGVQPADAASVSTLNTTGSWTA